MRRMERKLYTLKEASELSGVPVKTLQTMLGRKKINGVKGLRGKKPEWLLAPETILSLGLERGEKDYWQLHAQWVTEQANGYHSGRPLMPSSIRANVDGLASFWKKLGKKESTKDITPEALRLAISNWEIDYERGKCHFVQKEHAYKGVLSFARLLVREGLLSPLDIEALKAQRPKRVFDPVRKSLNRDKALQLLKTAEHRDGRPAKEQQCGLAAVALMIYAGLRQAEVRKLMLSHVDFPARLILIVDGKGHKNRIVGLNHALETILKDWLAIRPKSPHQNLLLNKHGEPLTGNAIRLKVQRLSKRAGVDIASHGLRRTFATLLSDRNVPPEHIRLSLGHSSLKTTQESYLMTDPLAAAQSVRGEVVQNPAPERTRRGWR